MSQNLAVVLQQLHDRGPASRADLARSTGLSKATISSLVAELAVLGVVRDVDGAGAHGDAAEAGGGRTGRPATLVTVSGRRAAAIGLEVNVDYLAVAAVDLEGRVAHPRLVEIDADHTAPAAVVDRLVSLTAKVVGQLAADGRNAVGVGLAVPGLVAQPDGRVLVAPNLGWADVAITTSLTDRLRRRGVNAGPVVTDNEANMAALAHRPAMRDLGARSYLTVSGGVGVGAGVVLDGRLFRGAHGFGGELGHFVVEPEGRSCRCGNRGCLETVAGEDHLLHTLGLRRRAAPRSGPTAGQGPSWLETVVGRAERGDRRTLDGLERVGSSLAVALAAAVNLFDPEAIVLAGYFAPLAPWLTPAIRATLSAQVLGHRWAPLPVVASEHGRSAAVVGAAQLALTPLLADPSALAE